MAKTLREVLLQSGLSKEQIDAIDAKALAAGDSYYTTVETAAAEKERLASEASVKAEADRKAAEASAAAAKAAQEAAELEGRSVKDFWANTYSPGIAAAEAEKVKIAKEAADAKAEAAFYKTQRESYLGTLGIKPEDAPVFTPVSPVATDPNKTPGTPTFTLNDVRDQLGTSLGTVANIQWEYQTLYGKPMPISPTEFLRQSEANKFKDPATYASQLFKFGEKREEMRVAAHNAELKAAADAAVAAKDVEHKAELKKIQDEFSAKERLRAEQGGNNPDVKLPPGSSKFSDLQRAQKAGERPDPTRMSQAERRALTSANIHKAIEERQAVVA